MNSGWKAIGWAFAALAACALLLAVLAVEHGGERSSWVVQFAGDPSLGSRIFGEKGCSECHSASAPEPRLTWSLHLTRPASANPNQLLTRMWNHAPQMRDRMRTERRDFRPLAPQDVGHLFAFLHASRYIEKPGDPIRGRLLFQAKGCVRCHAMRRVDLSGGPDLSVLGPIDGPAAWARAMWNHSTAMEALINRTGLLWPQFEDREMDHLSAFLREAAHGAPAAID